MITRVNCLSRWGVSLCVIQVPDEPGPARLVALTLTACGQAQSLGGCGDAVRDPESPLASETRAALTPKHHPHLGSLRATRCHSERIARHDPSQERCRESWLYTTHTSRPRDPLNRVPVTNPNLTPLRGVCDVQGVGFTGGPEETRHGGSAWVMDQAGPARDPGGTQDPIVLARERGRKATAGSWPKFGAVKGGSGTRGMRPACSQPPKL